MKDPLDLTGSIKPINTPALALYLLFSIEIQRQSISINPLNLKESRELRDYSVNSKQAWQSYDHQQCMSPYHVYVR